MIIVIIGIGFVSQLNLFILSKCWKSRFLKDGAEGISKLFGKRMIRLYAFIGLFFIFMKMAIFTIGYSDIMHQYIFPSINNNWLILFIFLTSLYLASKGMEKTFQFVVIVMLSTFWIIFVFIPFLFAPMSSIHDLYPLIPNDPSLFSWKGVLLIWSSLSGPEYLIFLKPWLTHDKRQFMYFTIGNMISVLEYLLLFIAAILFFGSNYLSKTLYPTIDMIKYLQSPVFERMEIIVISVYLFYIVFALALFLLFFYGLSRLALAKWNLQTTRKGYLFCAAVILSSFLIFYNFLWKFSYKGFWGLDLEIALSSLSYLIIPIILWIAIKRKEDV
ncbi:GerAB/ArcD/ProY family transporter [Neobacillus sp. PS3-40]|uniref:GerAB/ArcD/ProY family transporter n=1 Tax=Neobacillus sp. PS3-40 TaxID=3070679 RepID=UPI0027E105E7|nr:GerAB/ArcD/ProY family transporter [Neobacillus sp. PS3-40]WML46366.1 GerAB/ArcD/ProY family transporter [Neobacillus sp. PS3-40]